MPQAQPKAVQTRQSKGGLFMRLNSGDYAPRSGSYKVIDAQGKTVNTIYIAEGETMPPTQQSGCHYEFCGEE